jgi:predicted transcriptional regulator of viral defense system
MKFDGLISCVGDEPLFETGLLLAGQVNPAAVRKQLSLWVAAGKIVQLRRGVYALAAPYRKVAPHPFLIANRLQPGSYVSLQAALAYYGMIPEGTPVTTSVSSGRPELLHTPLGDYLYRHVNTAWLHGYRRMELGSGQQAFVAAPEKALLDLVYLEAEGDSLPYLRGLRLQNLEQLDWYQLQHLAQSSSKPKLLRAVDNLQILITEEGAYETL